ncbi:hypothetical protein BB560_000687 [Smittium megazygosporum]|uniref:Anaphase-promoting complex subunit 4 WD40 domain-containing protein n=1 Tax=Smittium megazygosporum TaxID=133381 RepID=A0A2T9ZJM7_9FUNG|nr:hypothetical protein BB560_000687 [Smittium megazygosporum]
MDAPKDVEITQPPSDTVSEIQFSPKAEFLAAASWDNSVRIWEIQNNSISIGKSMYSHDAPALCVAWSTDGTKVVSGGGDNAGRMLDITTGSVSQVAAHDAPIRRIKFVESPNSSPILATGSWDKTIKMWDLRTSNPVMNISLPERCYVMDAINPLLIVGTAERHILAFDLNNPSTPYKTENSPLTLQTRSIACFLDKNGYVIGSIGGRVGVHYLKDQTPSKNFKFKCHRSGNNVFAVNSISIHPATGIVATGGSDGGINFWNTEIRSRAKSFATMPSPVTSINFNRTGDLFAYAIGYDWHKGYKFSVPTDKKTIYLHTVTPDELKKKK